MNQSNFCCHFPRIARREVTEGDFKDALKQVLLSPKGRGQEREPRACEG